jgi:hypothetical protein
VEPDGKTSCTQHRSFRACSKSGILALQTPKFYLAGSKRSRKPGFLRPIDRKNPQFEQALSVTFAAACTANYGLRFAHISQKLIHLSSYEYTCILYKAIASFHKKQGT